MFDRAKDYVSSNKYAIEEYIINDGKKHPVAIVCPGGGYSRIDEAVSFWLKV